MKFSEFNKEINPNNENIYVVESSVNTVKNLSLSEVKKVSSQYNDSVIKIKLPKGYAVIKTTCKKVLDVIKDLQEQVMVVEYNGEYNIWCKCNVNTNTTNNILACGVDADVIGKKDTYIVIPYSSPNSTNAVSTQQKKLYSNGIKECPIWLKPLLKVSSPDKKGLQIPIVNNTQLILRDHFARLVGFNKYDQEDILNLINKYFVASPMTPQEVQNLIEILNSSLLSSFVEKGQLMHWKLGDYVISSCHIKRDTISKELYFYDSKSKIYTNDVDFLMGYLTRLIPQLKQYQKDETKSYIQNSLYDSSVEFNKNELSIVFRNGVLDLSTWSFEPMSPEHLESIQIDVDYNPNAVSKTADEFFATATCNNSDVETLLYEAIGYSLLKTSELAKSFVLTGNGRNGKSTYLDIIKAILGKRNFATISFKDLSSNFRVSQLKGKLASLAGDISSQPIQDSDLFKSIASFEEVTLEEKYKQSYSDKLFATLFFSCNKLPRTPDTTLGFYRRMVIIPFNADLSKVTTIDGVLFKKKLLSEESLSYITYKALQAIYNVLNTTREFTEPTCVKDMMNKYKIDNSTVLSWFQERFNSDVKNLANKPIGKLYGNYTAWCDESGRLPSSKTTFKQQVESEIGFTILT